MGSSTYKSIGLVTLFVTAFSCNSLAIPTYSDPHFASSHPEMQFVIDKTWDNQTTEDGTEIHVSFQVVDEYYPYSGKGMVLKFDAPYFSDPLIADTVPVDKPFLGLWNYEVVEAFFLGQDEEYLEIELGPKGHYILLFLKGPNNLITYQLPLQNYSAECSTVSSRWIGTAFIPGEYFPCNITKFQAGAIHKSDPERVYMALFPTPKGKYEAADFHRLEYFQPISLGVELNPRCSSMGSSGISGSMGVEKEKEPDTATSVYSNTNTV